MRYVIIDFMPWDFSTDPDFQQKLDWAAAFVREHCERLDLVYPELHYTPPTPEIREVIQPLKQAVRPSMVFCTGMRSFIDADARDVHRSGGSVKWESQSMM